jgi:hypothetical protein
MRASECLLDDFPSARHFEERKQVRHPDARARQISRPSGDFKANDRNGIEYVDADYAGLDLRRGTILVDPVEQELGSGGEPFPGIAEEGSVRVEGRAHEFAFALFASVNVHLHGLDDAIVVGEVFVVSHAADSRIGACGASTDKSGQRRTRKYYVWIVSGPRIDCAARPRGVTLVTAAVAAGILSHFHTVHD